jgi:dynein assembly factor with WDR repeat domains 1
MLGTCKAVTNGLHLVGVMPAAQVYAIAFNNPFGDKVVTGSFDKTARIWNAHTGQCLLILKGQQLLLLPSSSQTSC